jgi:hypothetical protein
MTSHFHMQQLDTVIYSNLRSINQSSPPLGDVPPWDDFFGEHRNYPLSLEFTSGRA